MKINKNKCYRLFYFYGNYLGNIEDSYAESGNPVDYRRIIYGQSIVCARHVVCKKYFGIIEIENIIFNVVRNG